MHSNNAYCAKCEGDQLVTFSDSIQTHDILIIRIHRFSDNFNKIDKKVTPIDIIIIGSSRYKLKCYIIHHGQSAKSGHYTSTFPRENDCLLTFSDEVRTEKTEHSEDPYMLFYERIEIQDSTEKQDAEAGPSEVSSVACSAITASKTPVKQQPQQV